MADAPPITRIGVKANFFDTEIKGAPDTGGFETGPFTIGDIVIPPEMGLFQKMIGVQWATGKFMLVGGNVTLNSAFIDDFDFPWNRFTCTSGVSRDGQNWEGGAGFSIGGNAGGGGTNGGSVFLCGIRGQKTYFAGGFQVRILAETGIPGVFSTRGEAVIAFSEDGVTWSSQTLPSINPEFDSEVNAVTYNPNTRSFSAYVTGISSVIPDVVFDNATYTFPEPNTTPSSGNTTDKPIQIVTTGSGVAAGFPLPTDLPAGDYVACSRNGQTMKFGDGGTMQLTNSETQIRITTKDTTSITAPPDVSVIIGAAINSAGDTIVASVLDNNQGGGEDDPIPEPHVYVSTDQGESWQETFPAATAGNEDINHGYGSVSFS